MADKDVGGSWESIGRRWAQDSAPPEMKMLTYDYERDDSHDGVIYGPSGDVISRVVDRAPKMGFKPTADCGKSAKSTPPGTSRSVS